MSRPSGPKIAAAAVGLAALGLAVLAVGVGRGWAEKDGGTYAPARPIATARWEPATALFGDVVTAHASVLVDRRAVDPRTVRVAGRFKPFRVLSASRSAVDGVGRSTLVRLSFRLQCVTSGCVEAMEKEERGGTVRPIPVAFPAARLTMRGRDGAAIAQPLRWPPLVLHSRLTAERISDGVPLAQPLVGDPVSYRFAPGVAGALLVGTAALLILLAGALVGSILWTTRAERPLRLPAHLTAVERALALARHELSSGNVEGGRKALERLAGALEEAGDRDHAAAAARLAWSEGAPSDETVETLAETMGGRRNGR